MMGLSTRLSNTLGQPCCFGNDAASALVPFLQLGLPDQAWLLRSMHACLPDQLLACCLVLGIVRNRSQQKGCSVCMEQASKTSVWRGRT